MSNQMLRHGIVDYLGDAGTGGHDQLAFKQEFAAALTVWTFRVVPRRSAWPSPRDKTDSLRRSNAPAAESA